MRALSKTSRAAGLTGRGGAGFPTARKLDSVRAGHRRPLLAVNAMEGEPASQKDRALLSAAPHLVLDGAELVAAAIGAREITVCVADDQDDNADGTSRPRWPSGPGPGWTVSRPSAPPAGKLRQR